MVSSIFLDATRLGLSYSYVSATDLKELAEAYAREDALNNAAAASTGQAMNSHLSPKTFIKVGRDLLKRQYVYCSYSRVLYLIVSSRRDLLSWIRKNPKLKQSERTGLLIRKTALQRDIIKWTISQDYHMTHIQWARTNNDFTFNTLKSAYKSKSGSSSAIPQLSDTSTTAPLPHQPVSPNYSLGDVENIASVKLWLPSDVPSIVRHLVASAELIAAERALLLADLHNCLVAIRKHCQALSAISRGRRGDWQAPSANAASAKQRERVTGIGIKVEEFRTRYTHAWDRLCYLDPDGNWLDTYKKLERADIRGPSISDDIDDLHARKWKKKGFPYDLGQGTYVQSWIWRVALNKSTEPNETLRVHWTKAVANRDRWLEQKELVPEEMRRTLVYFRWQVVWWGAQVGRRHDASLILKEALDAHARRQQDLYQQRLVIFSTAWLPYLDSVGIKPEWADEFRSLVPHIAWEGRKRGAPLGCELDIPAFPRVF